jgi:lysophospholipase L1-like esterase
MSALLGFLALLGSLLAAASNNVVFIEPDFPPSNLTRLEAVCATRGGLYFDALSLKAWPLPYQPLNASSVLPAPDSATVAFLQRARSLSPAPLKVYAAIDVCPGPLYTCMLDYSLSNLTGRQLASAAMAAGLDGVQLYTSPYCNNADCKRTTGKYAVGIAAMVSSLKAAAPHLDVVLLANEWDHVEIIARGGPTAVYSYQTVFYFTSVADCQAAAGALCGAGESIDYVQRAARNFTAILDYLAAHRVAFLGQLHGASTPEVSNPPDYWQALAQYKKGLPLAAPPAATTLPVASLYTAPYSWAPPPGGPATTLCASAPGSLLRALVTNTSTVTLLLNGTGDLQGPPGLPGPLLAWSIDSDPYSLAQAYNGSGAAAQALLLGSGLDAAQPHTLRLVLASSVESKDRWLLKPAAQGGNQFVCVTGLQVDAGGGGAPPPLRPRSMLVFGDSITEGTSALRMVFGPGTAGPGAANGGWRCEGADTYHNSALHSWASHAADALDAELSAAAFAAQGYVTTNSYNYGSVPPFFTPGNPTASAWQWVYGGASRLPALAASPPDLLLNALGFNDQNVPPAALTAAVAGSLAALRAAAGPSTALLQVLPFGGALRTGNATRLALLAGFEQYKATPSGAADACAAVLDAGSGAAEGLQGLGSSTVFSCDGTHPNALAHARLGAMVASAAARLLAALPPQCAGSGRAQW